MARCHCRGPHRPTPDPAGLVAAPSWPATPRARRVGPRRSRTVPTWNAAAHSRSSSATAAAQVSLSQSPGRAAPAVPVSADEVVILADSRYTRVPDQGELKLNPDAAYLHFTSNETIEGVEWKSEPEVGNVPLVCDASSDICSRPVDVSKYALIYAGAQKNLGPSGVTVAVGPCCS